MPGLRVPCAYCKTDVLTRDVGNHIIKYHKEEVFSDKTNLRALHNDNNLRKPLELILSDTLYYFCMADRSCIKKEILADNHFKGKADAHREAILKLRLDFPSGKPVQPSVDQTVQQTVAPPVQTPIKVPSESLLNEKEKKTLQDFVVQCIISDEIGLSSKDKKVFEKLGCILDPEKLKEMYPHLFEKEEEEEEDHEEPEAEPLAEDQEVLPLTLPKPMTKQEAFNHIMTAKDIKTLTTSIATGKTIEVPELKAFQGKSSIPRPTDLQLMQASRPVKQEAAMKLIQVTKRGPKQAEG